MAAKFVVFRDKAKKFRFRLVAPNNEIIAASEAYESKEACLKGIKAVQKDAPIAVVKDETLVKETAKEAVKKPAAKKAAASKPAAKKPAAKKPADNNATPK